jgi:hypothetical protein
MVKENAWNRDTHIRITDDDEVIEEFVMHGIEGEADEKITLQDIKTCVKYFGALIDDLLDDVEYSMALRLAFQEEAIQRGGKFECNMLDTIPLMNKWLTDEAAEYLKDKIAKRLGIEDGQDE